MSNVPTLHTIGVSRCPKLRIDVRLAVYSGWQRHFIAVDEADGKRRRRVARAAAAAVRWGLRQLRNLAPVQVFQRLRHAFGGQRVHIHRVGTLEELVGIGHRASSRGELGLEPPETQRRQHQQRRNAGHQQPRHIEE